ncbi:hypothetical protein UACE39S_01728 [Ureibacillus acetophenoni]
MKKVIIFMFLLTFILSGCSQPKETETQEEVKKIEEVEEIEVNPEINVTLDLEILVDQGKVEFIGKTNLPDETEIMITLTNDNGYTAQDKRSIQDGSFTSGPFSNRKSALHNGTYNVKITTPTASVQTESVKKIIGDKGVNLVGDLIKYDSTFGNQLEYNESFEIGTTTSTSKADDEEIDTKYSEEEVFDYMENLYNELTNYGENYIPEVHDPQVAEMAANKFGISALEAGQIYIDVSMEMAGY